METGLEKFLRGRETVEGARAGKRGGRHHRDADGSNYLRNLKR